jgi:hypothetical protein
MQMNRRLMFEEIARFREELMTLETADSPFVKVFRAGTRIVLFLSLASVICSSLYERVKSGALLF